MRDKKENYIRKKIKFNNALPLKTQVTEHGRCNRDFSMTNMRRQSVCLSCTYTEKNIAPHQCHA